ncbi:MAG: DNA repair protein RecN [Oscillospiraceae bacterium]|nr:DNA repair protein RecN [Oscillospiraceae bacterium]
MLEFLHIENIAVIEKSDIELSNGLNILTGETGAGKSIIIDSINAILGERTSKDLIRTGCERAEVSAIFSNLNKPVLDLLCENGFSVDEDGKLLVKRVLSQSGGSVKINGKPSTVSLLKIIGQALVNIHGQHDNQNLLDPQNHILYIDKMAENEQLLSDYYQEFKRLNAIRKELRALEMDEEEKARKIELLKYQIDEIERADITVGEVASLKEKISLAHSKEKILNTINTISGIFEGSDDKNGVISGLEEINRLLSQIDIKALEADSQHLSDALFTIKDVSQNIRDYESNEGIDNLDLNALEERLDLLRRIMLKYGGSEEKVFEYLENSKADLEKIAFSEKRIDELSSELDNSTECLIEKAEKLTKSRIDASNKFAKEICNVLSFLDMPSVKFLVDIKKGRYTKIGCDEIEFLIGTNVGEDIKPLYKIASGGELSRVMLAIKSVLAEKDDTQTLIFDEIDTGISGHAASKVGVQLKKVSKNRQVISVTHLAQISAFADNHLLIQKHTENDRVFTNVKSLSYDEKILEIARIMSGNKITDNLYNSAKELLDRSQNDENL